MAVKSKNIPAPEPATPKPDNHNDTLELQSDNGEQTLGILPIEGIENKTSSFATGSGPDRIDLELKRDSWIEIKDANDQKLFHDLALGGEKYSIQGTAPFNLLFGFSPGVTMKFNGKIFNHSRYSNNGIARFKLPEQQ